MLTDATVDRVLLEHATAVGVRTANSSGTLRHHARGEVILAAGTLASPTILQCSGIRPAALLHPLKIPVVVDAPNVGRRMREHRCFFLHVRLRDNGRPQPAGSAARASGRLISGLRYRLTRGGPLAARGYDLVGFFRTRADLDRPHAQLQVAPPYTVTSPAPGKLLDPGGWPSATRCGRTARAVSDDSPDPTAPPVITPHYFARRP